MSQRHALIGLLVLTLSLTGCAKNDKNYTISADEDDSNIKIVEMKTYDPASAPFTFRFDKNLWEIETWDEEKAPNRVAMIHTQYPDKNCFILPGSIGLGKEIEATVVEGSFLTSGYAGRTITVMHPAGYLLKEVVGYEVDGTPYIFELNPPSKNADACKQDAQMVIGSFNMVQ